MIRSIEEVNVAAKHRDPFVMLDSQAARFTITKRASGCFGILDRPGGYRYAALWVPMGRVG